MKKGNQKGYIAPIIVTVILLLYFILYFGVLIVILPGVWKYLLLIFPTTFAGILLYVCTQRIKEIRSGEEDDLSKY